MKEEEAKRKKQELIKQRLELINIQLIFSLSE